MTLLYAELPESDKESRWKSLTELVLKLKRAFWVLFEPDDEPDNTIYQLDPDSFGSFLPVRPIINIPHKRPRRFLIYEVGFDINCSEQEAVQRFQDSLSELFSLLAHDITRNICNCLGPEREIEHEIRFPITIKLDLDQSVWDFMLSGEAYDVGPWLKDCKALDVVVLTDAMGKNDDTS